MGSLRLQTGITEETKETLLPSTELYSELRQGRSDGGDEELKQNHIQSIQDGAERLWMKIKGTAMKEYRLGRSDPRKVVFAAKMGLALSLISLLILWKGSINFIGDNAIWAIMTVVVVFEFSIGATFNKGFNRALGTFSAGALSVGIGELSGLTGVFHEAMIFISIFIVGFAASYAKLYPTMKDFEYGFRVFLITYCIVLASGSTDFVRTALIRLFLIACGAAVCLVVNACIYPIWAGEDLHKSVVKNFMGVADSLEGCVNGYVQCFEYGRISSKFLTFQASDDPVYNGYRSAVESASKEDSLMQFAMWEPPHGRYNKQKYPWNLFIRVGGALRHSAFMVMAMHGCMLSEIQAPAELRQEFSQELKRVGAEGAKVLRELGDKLKNMEKLSPGDMLQDVHRAAEQLQMSIDQKSHLLVNSKSWQSVIDDPASFLDAHESEEKLHGPNKISVSSLKNLEPQQQQKVHRTVSSFRSGSSDNASGKQVAWPSRLSVEGDIVLNEREVRTYESATALSLGTFTSMLIEFVARLQNLVESFRELSEKANFKETVDQTSTRKASIATTIWAKLVKIWAKLLQCA
ncbi:hypothetical protein Droror1_Dr00009378 [Drosera rotundifolia]